MRFESIFLFFCLIPVFLFRSPAAQKLTPDLDKNVETNRIVFDDLSSSSDSSDSSDDVENGVKIKTFKLARPSMISRNSNLSFHKYPTLSEITPINHVFKSKITRKVGSVNFLKLILDNFSPLNNLKDHDAGTVATSK